MWGVGGRLNLGEKLKSGKLKDENFLAVRTSVYVTCSQSGRGRFDTWDAERQL